MCSAPKPLIWWSTNNFNIKRLWNGLLFGYTHWVAIIFFENLSKILSKKLCKKSQISEKCQSRYVHFCFPPACNHGIFCFTQIQLYRVGNWQFGYFYVFGNLSICFKNSLWQSFQNQKSDMYFFRCPFFTPPYHTIP